MKAPRSRDVRGGADSGSRGGGAGWIARALALVLAVPALLASGLAQGGRWSPHLDLLTHAAPAYVGVALAGVLLALLGRARRWTLGLTLAALAASASLVVPEYVRDAGPTAPADAPGQLKVVQFNAWVANSQTREATRWIVAQNPDIVILIEGRIMRYQLMKAGYVPSCYGCAPVIYARTKPLRRFPPPGNWNETSRFTYSTYRDARGEFTVVAQHADWPTKMESVRTQRRSLLAHMKGWPRARIILAGDLNSTPWSFDRQRADREFGLTRRTRGVFSWPADRANHNPFPSPLPYLPIDHLYAGAGWATVSVTRGPRLGSDHYPIVTVLAPVR